MQTGISQQRPGTPEEKHLQQLLARESKQVPLANLGILILLFAGKVVCFRHDAQGFIALPCPALPCPALPCPALPCPAAGSI